MYKLQFLIIFAILLFYLLTMLYNDDIILDQNISDIRCSLRLNSCSFKNWILRFYYYIIEKGNKYIYEEKDTYYR